MNYILYYSQQGRGPKVEEFKPWFVILYCGLILFVQDPNSLALSFNLIKLPLSSFFVAYVSCYES